MPTLYSIILPDAVIQIMEAVAAWSSSGALPSRPVWPEEYVSAWEEEACPEDMVDMGLYCIDRYPYPNREGEEPLLGVSAIREHYLDVSEVWDCETLCSNQEKRLCTWGEWSEACRGTPMEKCGGMRKYRDPDWAKVMRREPAEMQRLDQHPSVSDYPECVSERGAYMMTTLEEWVSLGEGYAFSRGFWSREAGCGSLNRAHAANWHDYATACRCCQDSLL